MKKDNLIDVVMEKIKEKGGRVTIQRLAIINVLLKLDHPTAEEIYQFMRNEFPTLSFTTVYNTLHSLHEMGILREYRFGEASRFEMAETNHHHFLCQKCGGMKDIEDSNITVHLDEKLSRHYHILNTEVVLKGLCQDCMGEGI
ncbi:Fur family transcriptional regulator [Ammoniphilus resinae]|uniref:Fur family peroxide stress response transcriptional regulator n=1 Tax=Ammoniphilus resinae TaxID=861532 RepID=A0ABS4GTM8_9BACL|nr:transcriptional repressor [Ammoniphilus resinae]MBP1933614.1 Fur family peroxide stress response transcriptional regulator [Ammoniphilus resinae]